MGLALAANGIGSSFSRGFLAHDSPNFTCADDETLRRWTYIVEREARKQREVVLCRGFQDAKVRGCHDFDRLDNVLITALPSFEFDFVPHANVAERAEKGVSMAG